MMPLVWYDPEFSKASNAFTFAIVRNHFPKIHITETREQLYQRVNRLDICNIIICAEISDETYHCLIQSKRVNKIYIYCPGT